MCVVTILPWVRYGKARQIKTEKLEMGSNTVNFVGKRQCHSKTSSDQWKEPEVTQRQVLWRKGARNFLAICSPVLPHSYASRDRGPAEPRPLVIPVQVPAYHLPGKASHHVVGGPQGKEINPPATCHVREQIPWPQPSLQKTTSPTRSFTATTQLSYSWLLNAQCLLLKK